MKKRFLAAFLVFCLILGILPVSAMAAVGFWGGGTPPPSVEETTVTVEYPTTDRSTATITYHKEGIEADSYNLIFLVDTSRQGANSHAAFERMMNENGTGYIYDYDSDSTIQMITYQNTASNTGIMYTKDAFMEEFGDHGVSGEGTANEPAALNAAISAVEDAHEENDYPTVVFWVLGEEFGEKDTDKIEEKLKELDSTLVDGKDALITWQNGEQPSQLLAQYATQYKDAHDDSGQKHPAAYAVSDQVMMQEEMAADLEQIVHDHYHNISFSLALDDAQTLVKKFNDIQYEAESSMVGLSANLWEDGQGVDVHIERMCRQIDIDFILEAELDTNVYEKQTVIPADKIIVDSSTDGGLHTGLFDERIEYGLELDLPPVEIDRIAYNVIFQNADGVDDITNKLSGELVTLPSGDGITQEGASFGGWNVVAGANMGRHYAPGEIIPMPSGNMTLEPAFGHVEVTLEVAYEKGEIPEYGNQMYQFRFSDADWNPFYFEGVTLPDGGGTISSDDVVSIQVIDFLPEFDFIDGEWRQVKMTNVPNAVYARHIGSTPNDRVVAYLVPSSLQSGKYDMYIAGPGGVKAPADCSYMFGHGYDFNDKYGFDNVETIDARYLDTSDVTNMREMFSGCPSLRSLDVSSFDTSNVTNMRAMFSNCKSLSSLDVSGFNTANVTDMGGMFYGCLSLSSLDVSNFDTANVTDMGYMFHFCLSLSSLDMSGFDTANVTDMYAMFSGCESLSSLDVSGFDTANVTSMGAMFEDCKSLSSLDVSGFDTANVISMRAMFADCEGVTSLDVSGFDTSNMTDMRYVFSGCESLSSLDVSGFNTAKVTDMDGMFQSCKSLNSLDVSGFDTANVTSMYAMFSHCEGVTSLDVSSFNTSNVTSMNRMFWNCYDLTSLDVSSFDTSNVTDMGGMFDGCVSLTSLDVSSFDTSNVTDMYGMFQSCRNLQALDLGDSFTISNVKRVDYIFSGCSSLKSITGIGLGETNAVTSFASFFKNLKQLEVVTFHTPENGASFPNLSTMENMFSGCENLKSVDLGNWTLENLTNTSAMFYGCNNLESLDLSWSGIRATSGYSIDEMFWNVPSSSTMEIGSDHSVMMTAIADAFPGKVTSEGQPVTVKDEIPEEVPEEIPDESQTTPEEVPEEMPDESQTMPEEVPEEMPDESQTTPEEVPEEIPDESQTTPEEVPEEIPDESQTTPEEASQNPDVTEETFTDKTDNVSVASMGASKLTFAGAPAANENDAVYIYPDMVSEYDTITYKVTVKYVGDLGVKSGRIHLNFPIPDDIQKFQGDPNDPNYVNSGWYVSRTDITYSDAPTGYMSGKIVEEPEVVTLEDGSYVLQGTFEGLYTGTEVSVSIMTTVKGKADEEYHENGYAFWDATAYASDHAGTASSRTVRLWNRKDENPTPPPANVYQMKYAFVGDVPEDVVLPDTAVVESGTQVTTAGVPESSLEGYTFDGWYRSDTNQKVAPNESFGMPSTDVTLTGKWTLDDQYVQNVTVKYAYVDNDDGKVQPDGAPALPEEQSVKVGNNHYIQKIERDTDYHKFDGWVPTLSVGGQDIPLTKQADGTYQDSSKTYTIDIAEGILSTEQFRNKDDVVVTFNGTWTPYKGIIFFDGNGGEGYMNDMQDITWYTTKTLTENEFTYPYDGYHFSGWAKTPSGNVVKSDGDTADQLISKDGEAVYLYAIWKRTDYDVGYDLNHVTSSNMGTTVSYGGSYKTTLTADSGYKMENVSVTMGGSSITNQVYDETTGKVEIDNITGNIVIRAEAVPIVAKEHTIAVSVTNGTASPSGLVKVQDGQDQKITFTPNAGYVLDSVTVDGNTASLTGNSYTFTNVTADHSISVVYKSSEGGGGSHNRYPIYVDSVGDGTASANKDKASAGEIVTITTNGTVEHITATDAKGNPISVVDNGSGSYTFRMPKSKVRVVVTFAGAENGVADPNDTGVSNWLDTVDHGAYLSGYENGEFRPDNPMTRAEVAQMFYNLLLDQNVPITVSFVDVPADAWYAEAVNTLASMGMLAGVGDGCFAPDRPITRAEFTAIAMRFTDGDVGGENIFSDVSEEDWFYDQIVGSIQYGWINGYSDGTFRPNQTITRAEVTTIVNKMLGRSADAEFINEHQAELISFRDVSQTHWAYCNIAEATNTHAHTKNEPLEKWIKLK